MSEKMTKGQRLAHYYGLEDLDKYNLGIIEDIGKSLKNEWLGDLSALLNGNDVQRLFNIQLLCNVQVQQNWIIIRQLNEITKLLTSNSHDENTATDRGLDDAQDRDIAPSSEELLSSIEDADYLETVRKFKTAKQIYDYTVAYAGAHEDFPKQLLDSISKIAQTERLYGNMYDDCLMKIEEILN